MSISGRKIESEDRCMLRRQEGFRAAAVHVARELGGVEAVVKVTLFGSVAKPLSKEVPRFREFRRAGVEILHECKDVDVAVWVTDLGCLRALQRARSDGLKKLLADRNIGVAHHQVDVFVMDPGTGRYIGRLCTFSKCPKGKPDCRVPGCGETKLLKLHEWDGFDPERFVRGVEEGVVLFERGGPSDGEVAAGASPEDLTTEARRHGAREG